MKSHSSKCQKFTKNKSNKKTSLTHNTFFPSTVQPNKLIDSVIHSSSVTLPYETKEFFEPRLRISLNNINIHKDKIASQSAENLNAEAYTYDNHIVFNEGKYKPGTKEGNKLLAHELAHVHLHSGKKTIARQAKPSTPKPTAAEIEKAIRQRDASALFWTDLKTNFPDDVRKIAGSYHNDAIDYLSTDFTEGEVVEAGVKTVYSSPRIVIGKKYGVEKDAAKRQAYIKAEIDKIDIWRFEQRRIDNDDLSNATIIGKLDALDVFKKGEYIQKLIAATKIKNDKVQEYIRKKMPSTPAMAGATPTAAGGFEFQFANIKIIVMPDVFNDASVDAGTGETKLKPVNSPTYTISPAYEWSGDNKITKITPMPTVPDVIFSVETHYGPGADPAGSSGYGAGTSAADKAAGNISLRFHEGSHGTVFIEAVKNNFAANPYPVFPGKIGDAKRAFERALPGYGAKVNAFRKVLTDAIDASVQKVDCVGKTIEQYYTAKGKVSQVKCRP
jgi:hypothetical protein